MATVILARHGRTAANTAGVLAGRSKGVHLDELGEKQAAAAGQRLAGLPLAAIVSSPMERCRETASAISKAQSARVAVRTDRELAEVDYGDWTGRPLEGADEAAAVEDGAGTSRRSCLSRRRVDGADERSRGCRRTTLGRRGRGRARAGRRVAARAATGPDQGGPRRRTRDAPRRIPAHRRRPGQFVGRALHAAAPFRAGDELARRRPGAPRAAASSDAASTPQRRRRRRRRWPPPGSTLRSASFEP